MFLIPAAASSGGHQSWGCLARAGTTEEMGVLWGLPLQAQGGETPGFSFPPAL